MTGRSLVTHEFVEFIPEQLIEGVVYVSIPYATAVHKCCSGCGREVVTPIKPDQWHLTFDGETISLAPSIGNWSFPCQSHYWIKCNQVRWDRSGTQAEINAGRARQGRTVRQESDTKRPETSTPLVDGRLGWRRYVARLCQLAHRHK